MLLFGLLIKSCTGSSKKDSYASYMGSVTDIARLSTANGKKVATVLTTPGLKVAEIDPSSRPREVLLVLDFEQNRHYPGGTMRVDQAVTFVERIRQRTGQYPGLYSGENRIRAILNSPRVSAEAKRVLARCAGFWVANYHVQPVNVSPWSRWTLWQVPTGDGVCDLPRASFPKSIANIRKAERNIFAGSPGDARSFWQAHGWTPGLVREF